jgi:FixJ family two-component response regulator
VTIGVGGGPVHLLLTDVVMPGVGGRELATRHLDRNPGLKVLFMSGYTGDAVIRHGVISEEMAFLEKPFTHEQLLSKVRDMLDAPQPLRP